MIYGKNIFTVGEENLLVSSILLWKAILICQWKFMFDSKFLKKSDLVKIVHLMGFKNESYVCFKIKLVDLRDLNN